MSESLKYNATGEKVRVMIISDAIISGESFFKVL
jgi:hypothetical protein